MEVLELHKIYNYEFIIKLAKKYGLKEGDRDHELYELSNDLLPYDKIGETTLLLYFDTDKSIACNFILCSSGRISYWRCIYICSAFSKNDKYEI